MVSTEELNIQVETISSRFYKLIEHTYLQQHINSPVIDTDKVSFLYAMLSKHLSSQDSQSLILSAILLQSALDVHEEVSLEKLEAEHAKKERQLTVLAGDYYSSLYYYLLAQLKSPEMIRIFSRSIQEINESKMNVYPSNLNQSTIQIDEVMIIESKLLQNISSYFKEDNWTRLFRHFFLLKRLRLNSERITNGKNITLTNARFDKEEQLEAKCEWLKDKVIEIASTIQGFDSFIIERLENMLKIATPKNDERKVRE
ncbi:heptaprenyl diphosphate synthase component 1 [Alkalihalobacillus pseudalcaliphilus]|uniref:heptaprenyl diphosphate synthase component 1 n=1 Tax=Alkalihalobacillus pseudalcaliphilus TaxID=79884 RepID=UPI00064D9849|nr:heptaprenyl diphosphate synthase component 1 [Alkalihalobacillus pseudalcaliphilus]KMK76447.1 hypothetical protein AB990_14770 [Alkalihalobacillus pseudalcaliphilus]